MNVAVRRRPFASSRRLKHGPVGIEFRSALVVCPEICSATWNGRDRTCHFIFGRRATAVLIESAPRMRLPLILKIQINPVARPSFRQHPATTTGFLRRLAPDAWPDRRDMQFSNA